MPHSPAHNKGVDTPGKKVVSALVLGTYFSVQMLYRRTNKPINQCPCVPKHESLSRRTSKLGPRLLEDHNISIIPETHATTLDPRPNGRSSHQHQGP